ncbi:hypothetical protein CRUP_032189 [Coryphaenoides rupestris]|nr:hypothetical protein CRUP_032189 [Coryphaenoides rupestris]
MVDTEMKMKMKQRGKVEGPQAWDSYTSPHSDGQCPKGSLLYRPAYSHPIALLSRTMNPYTKEVLEYKNADGKIIIVYDEDERIASQAAAVMCQRGFENLFMLSGGLKVIGQKFGEGMLIGPLPAACQPSSATPARRKKRCGASQLPSPTTTVTAPTPTTMQATTERKCRFTSEDLDKIQQQLEENLLPSSASKEEEDEEEEEEGGPGLDFATPPPPPPPPPSPPPMELLPTQGQTLRHYTATRPRPRRTQPPSSSSFSSSSSLSSSSKPQVLQVASISDMNLGANGDESPRPEDCQSVLSETELGPLAELSDGSPQATPTALHLTGHGEEGGDAHCTPRSTLQSVIGGVGELDLERNGRKTVASSTPESSPRWTEQPYPDCPYLLLDVRDRDQYDQCHIVSGLKVIGQKFGEGMLIGPLPAACQPSSATPARRKKRCGASQLPSPTTTVTAPTPTTMQATTERKCRFTSEDLDKIQQQLEENLLPSSASSRLSSRMSSSSAQSKVSSARSRLGSSMSGKDSTRDTSSRPWK